MLPTGKSDASKGSAVNHQICQAIVESLFTGSGRKGAGGAKGPETRTSWLCRYSECPCGKAGRVNFPSRVTCRAATVPRRAP